ncbi:MAG TPA: tail fiber protein [Verrucomicrobiales bacterium]|jgi:microcystin-dependent protein|nr:tail fiber protein [Verrucomicrobiales bacterium]
MASPFLAQITLFAGNFAPRGWAFCSGQILSIAQNTALFSLLGTNYGGNGQTTFALPDLRGRVPIQPGQGPGLSSYNLGQVGGEENHQLISTELPAHTHPAQLGVTSTPGNRQNPVGNIIATDASGGTALFSNAAPNGNAAAASVTVGAAGGGQSHNNVQPYLGLNYILALEGIFPSRN